MSKFPLILSLISIGATYVLYLRMRQLKGQLAYEKLLRREYLADIAHWQGLFHAAMVYQTERERTQAEQHGEAQAKIKRMTADTEIH